MPYQFAVEGWIDEAGIRHYGGNTPELDETYGVFVHVTHTTDSNVDDYFWAYDFGEFDDWSDWFDYIEYLMEKYGYVN